MSIPGFKIQKIFMDGLNCSFKLSQLKLNTLLEEQNM